jgi:hypothetical protein
MHSMRTRDWTAWTIAVALGACAREGRAEGVLVEAPPVVIDPWAYIEEPDIVVPLALKAGAALDAASARTLRVRVGEEPLQALVPAFKSSFVAPLQLAMKVDVKALPGPATYTIVVELSGSTGTPPTLTTQVVQVTWTLPAAKLAPIAPIVVRDALLWPSDSDDLRLFLREVSGRAKLTDITLSQPERPTHDGAPTESRLELSTTEEVRPRETILHVKRARSFPIGTTTGKLEIRAPQLVDPIVVPYEVRTRIHDWVIFPVFLLAGLFGWFVRANLKEREALAGMRAELELLAKQADEILRADPAALVPTNAVPAVRDAIDAGDLVAARRTLDDLHGKVEAALKARSDEIEKLHKEILPMKQSIDLPWKLPKRGDVPLHAAREALAAATKALQDEKLGAARSAQAEALSALDDAGEALGAWADSARDALRDLAADGLSKSAREEGTSVAPAEQKLKQVPAYNRAEPPEWGSYLRNIHDARWSLERLVARVASAFVRDAADVTLLATPENKDAATELAEAAKLDAAALAGDPVDGLKALHHTISAFMRIAKKHVTDQGALSALEVGDYAGAMAMQMSAGQMNDVKANIASGGWPAGLARAEIESPAPLAMSMPSGELILLRQSAEPVARARAELTRVRKESAVVSAAILAVVAWIIYRGAWVGTVNDFVAVTVTAFFTDFTLDAVLDTVGKLRKA